MPSRLFQEDGRNIYTGCELLLKGALEGKANLLTGYPGSPVSEFFDIIERHAPQLKERGVLAQLANNEALGAARLNGAQMANLRAMTVMKSVGVHVASDALAISNMAGAIGGAVAVMGEDPHSNSTQVPTDSRYLAQHLFMPIMEPATFQELKDWINTAFELSAETNLYIAYIITTHQADGGSIVELFPHPPLDTTPEKQATLDPTEIVKEERIILPPGTAKMEIDVTERRFPELLRRARELRLNRIENPRRGAPIGFVAAGGAYLYLQHALHELGAQGSFPLLKMGITYPLDEATVLEFAELTENIVVVEERRPLLEGQIKTLFADLKQRDESMRLPPVWGKQLPRGVEGFPSVLGLDPSNVLERLIPLFRAFPEIGVDPARLNYEESLLKTPPPEVKPKGADFESMQLPVLPSRTPGFCPGCPHRDSGTLLERIVQDFKDPEYMRKTHGVEPINLVFHGDIGCYSMFLYEPFDNLMHNLSGMGLGGGGAGAGADPFITNKQIVFMGDSTFFHSGLAGISDSIKHNQDIAYILLDNKTTGMTGHQTTPGLEYDLMGEPTRTQDIEAALRGLAGGDDILIIGAHPGDHEAYRALLERAILQDGVKFIIADKECGITYHRKQRREKRQIVKKKGYLPKETHINVTPEVCEFCLECTMATGCPALKFIDTDYGKKVETDLSKCVADEACVKGKHCPSFERVVVHRKGPPALPSIPTAVEADPPRLDFEDSYCIYSAGVGGMGIGVISAALALAGYKEGYQVHFCDKKGLAIRNGGVYAHMLFTKSKETVVSTLIPAGKANVILGMDPLEAARAADTRGSVRIASPDRTAVILNQSETETIPMLIGRAESDTEGAISLLESRARPDGFLAADFFEISEKHLGNKIYGNLMMLGAAYQRGLLPFDLDNLIWAVQNSVPPYDLEANMNAFNIGRLIVLEPERFADKEAPDYAETLADKTAILTEDQNARTANRYRKLVEESAAQMEALDDEELRHFAIRAYDLVQFENIDYARRYVDLVLGVYQKDALEYGLAATKAAIRYLHKTMCIKDEIYVSHLLTSEEKRRRDEARYNINRSNGDRLRYLHLNRPVFTILGKDIAFNMNTRNWQLRMMRRMKFLRRWMPSWHRREKEFRDWYIALVERFSYEDEASYKRMTEALECPEEARGYREVRYPKMEEARRRVERLLGGE